GGIVDGKGIPRGVLACSCGRRTGKGGRLGTGQGLLHGVGRRTQQAVQGFLARITRVESQGKNDSVHITGETTHQSQLGGRKVVETIESDQVDFFEKGRATVVRLDLCVPVQAHRVVSLRSV